MLNQPSHPGAPGKAVLSEVRKLWERTLGTGDSKCKGPGVRACLVLSESSNEARLMKGEEAQKSETVQRDRDISGLWPFL